MRFRSNSARLNFFLARYKRWADKFARKARLKTDLISTEHRANSVNLKAIIQVLACAPIKPLAQIKSDKSRCVFYALREIDN